MTRRSNDFLQERIVLPFEHAGSGSWVTPGVKATGLITCATKANLDDNDTFVLSDGTITKTYEFDTAGDGGTAGSVIMDVSGATTAATVATIVAAAINTAHPGITAVAVGDGTITLTNDQPGAFGNVTITENVTHATFLVSGMSGGLDPDNNVIGDTTIKLWKAPGPFRVDRVLYINPTGLAEDATNVFVIKLLKGSTVVASKSSDSDEAGDNNIVADTFYTLTLSATDADAVFAKDDEMKLFLDEGGTASLPPGRLIVEGRLL